MGDIGQVCLFLISFLSHIFNFTYMFYLYTNHNQANLIKKLKKCQHFAGYCPLKMLLLYVLVESNALISLLP